MKRIIVLMAVLAASFTAILVAPAIASAGCVLTAPPAAPTTTTSVVNGYPQELVNNTVTSHALNGGKVNCTSPANGNQYRVSYKIQLWNGSTWNNNMNSYADRWLFFNQTVNAEYPLTCFDYQGDNFVWPLGKVTCPTAYNHTGGRLIRDCVIQIPNPYTKFRYIYKITNLVTGSFAESASTSNTWDSCDTTN